MIKEIINQYEYDTDYEYDINTVYDIVDYVKSVLNSRDTTLEKLMATMEIKQEDIVFKEIETNEETNDVGTRIVRTKQPEIKHEIKYSKYTACNKYTKKTKVSKVTKLTEIINKYEKDTDYDFDKETYDDIKNENENIIYQILSLYTSIDEYTEQKNYNG